MLLLSFTVFSCIKQGESSQRGAGRQGNVQYTVVARENTNIQKYALVIGNSNYANISKLKNPVNDANDVSAVLQRLGFTVDKILNGSLEQMEKGIHTLKNRLGVSEDSYGFIFYAGHGVQSNGENYLIPVDANIQNETSLRLRAVSVQVMLDELNSASNILNIVVLDACRDNPFGWARSSSRGLTVLANPPSDSIIVYATSAGSVASDGEGRNGLFTSHFLPNLETGGLDANEVFRRTMGDVARASNNQQRPAIYNQFPGIAYLGSYPITETPAGIFESGTVSVAAGSMEISTVTAGTIEISTVITDGTVKKNNDINQKTNLPAWGTLSIAQISAGSYRIVMSYADGKKEEYTVEVGRNENKKVDFSYRPSAASAAQQTPAPAPRVYRIGDRGPGGGFVFYDKGSFSNGWRYLEAAPVDLQNADWGLSGYDITGTGTAIGTGKRNTELIVAALNKKGESGKAAQLCSAYTLNGYSDWFLPSKDELNELYKNLKKNNLGSLLNLWYWSSSQYDNHGYAWVQYFSDGSQDYSAKYGTNSVRAVRAF